jgi:uncharacterized membrane protein
MTTGTREQRATRAKATRSRRVTRGRIVAALAVVLVVVGVLDWLARDWPSVVAEAAGLAVVMLFAMNRPTRRRKRGRG